MDGGASASSLASQPASRRRFAITDDILLLHEVVALNPLRNATQWTAVTDNLNAATGRSFTVRSVRERCDLLLGHFRREDRSNLRKSGTEEQYTVKEQLLQEISDLAHEFGYLPKVLPRSSSAVASSTAGTAAGQVSIQRVSASADQRAGLAIREAATASGSAAAAAVATGQAAAERDENGDAQSPARRLLLQMCESGDQPAIVTRDPAVNAASNDDCSSQNENVVSPTCDTSRISASPPRKRRPLVRGKAPRSDVVAFLDKRDTNERVLKERQLNLEERRLALEEKRLALDQRKFDEEAQGRAEERHLQAEEKRLLLEVLLKQVKKD
ncbi:hypothetical protein ISCGN_025281 [Ixodes scapularis]